MSSVKGAFDDLYVTPANAKPKKGVAATATPSQGASSVKGAFDDLYEQPTSQRNRPPANSYRPPSSVTMEDVGQQYPLPLTDKEVQDGLDQAIRDGATRGIRPGESRIVPAGRGYNYKITAGQPKKGAIPLTAKVFNTDPSAEIADAENYGGTARLPALTMNPPSRPGTMVSDRMRSAQGMANNPSFVLPSQNIDRSYSPYGMGVSSASGIAQAANVEDVNRAGGVATRRSVYAPAEQTIRYNLKAQTGKDWEQTTERQKMDALNTYFDSQIKPNLSDGMDENSIEQMRQQFITTGYRYISAPDKSKLEAISDAALQQGAYAAMGQVMGGVEYGIRMAPVVGKAMRFGPIGAMATGAVTATEAISPGLLPDVVTDNLGVSEERKQGAEYAQTFRDYGRTPVMENLSWALGRENMQNSKTAMIDPRQMANEEAAAQLLPQIPTQILTALNPALGAAAMGVTFGGGSATAYYDQYREALPRMNAQIDEDNKRRVAQGLAPRPHLTENSADAWAFLTGASEFGTEYAGALLQSAALGMGGRTGKAVISGIEKVVGSNMAARAVAMPIEEVGEEVINNQINRAIGYTAKAIQGASPSESGDWWEEQINVAEITAKSMIPMMFLGMASGPVHGALDERQVQKSSAELDEMYKRWNQTKPEMAQIARAVASAARNGQIDGGMARAWQEDLQAANTKGKPIGRVKNESIKRISAIDEQLDNKNLSPENRKKLEDQKSWLLRQAAMASFILPIAGTASNRVNEAASARSEQISNIEQALELPVVAADPERVKRLKATKAKLEQEQAAEAVLTAPAQPEETAATGDFRTRIEGLVQKYGPERVKEQQEKLSELPGYSEAAFNQAVSGVGTTPKTAPSVAPEARGDTQMDRTGLPLAVPSIGFEVREREQLAREAEGGPSVGQYAAMLRDEGVEPAVNLRDIPAAPISQAAPEGRTPSGFESYEVPKMPTAKKAERGLLSPGTGVVPKRGPDPLLLNDPALADAVTRYNQSIAEIPFGLDVPEMTIERAASMDAETRREFFPDYVEPISEEDLQGLRDAELSAEEQEKLSMREMRGDMPQLRNVLSDLMETREDTPIRELLEESGIPRSLWINELSRFGGDYIVNHIKRSGLSVEENIGPDWQDKKVLKRLGITNKKLEKYGLYRLDAKDSTGGSLAGYKNPSSEKNSSLRFSRVPYQWNGKSPADLEGTELNDFVREMDAKNDHDVAILTAWDTADPIQEQSLSMSESEMNAWLENRERSDYWQSKNKVPEGMELPPEWNAPSEDVSPVSTELRPVYTDGGDIPGIVAPTRDINDPQFDQIKSTRKRYFENLSGVTAHPMVNGAISQNNIRQLRDRMDSVGEPYVEGRIRFLNTGVSANEPIESINEFVDRLVGYGAVVGYISPRELSVLWPGGDYEIHPIGEVTQTASGMFSSSAWLKGFADPVGISVGYAQKHLLNSKFDVSDSAWRSSIEGRKLWLEDIAGRKNDDIFNMKEVTNEERDEYRKQREWAESNRARESGIAAERARLRLPEQSATAPTGVEGNAAPVQADQSATAKEGDRPTGSIQAGGVLDSVATAAESAATDRGRGGIRQKPDVTIIKSSVKPGAKTGLTPTNAQMVRSALESAIRRLAPEYQGMVTISDFDTMLDNGKPSALPKDSAIGGVYDPNTNTVILSPSGIISQARILGVAPVVRAEQVFVHEVMRHFGLRVFMGKKFDGWLKNSVFASHRNDIYKFAQNSAYKDDTWDIKTEEWIIDEAEKGRLNDSKFNHILNRLTQIVNGSLRMMGFKNIKYSRRELAAILGDAARTMIKGKSNWWAQRPAENAGGIEGDPKFSIKTAGANLNDPADVARAAKMWAEMGTESPYFKRWFGDSKVVDANGKPLVVYHGTSEDFNTFDKSLASERSAWGVGFYFHPDPVKASSYANKRGSVMPVYLKIGKLFDTRSLTILPGGTTETKVFINNLKAQGYDGLVYDDGAGPSYVAFSPTQIKSATGNRGTFDAGNPDIRKSADPVTRDDQGNVIPLSKRFNERSDDIRFSKQAPIVPSPGIVIPEHRIYDGLARIFADEFYDLAKAQKAVEKSTGKKLADESNPYVKQALANAVASERMEQAKESLLKPLAEAVKDTGLTMEEVEEYLHALHAKERNARIAWINKSFKDTKEKGGSGMSDTAADRVMAKYDPEMTAKLMRVSDAVQAVVTAERQAYMESGLASPEQVRAWVEGEKIEDADLLREAGVKLPEPYKFYVPLKLTAQERSPEAQAILMQLKEQNRKATKEEQKILDRDDSTGRLKMGGRQVKGRIVHRAMGHEKPGSNILGNLAGQLVVAIQKSEQNKAKESLAQMVEQNPDEQLWQVDRRDVVTYTDPRTGEVKHQSKQPDDKHLIHFKRNGVPHTVWVADERIATPFRGYDPGTMRDAFAALGKLSRGWAKLQTQWAIPFVITNPIRDAQTAFFNLVGTQGFKFAFRAEFNLIPALQGIVRHMAGNRNQYWGKMYDEFRAAGGKMGYMDFHNVDQVAKELKAMVADARGGAWTWTKRNTRKVGSLITSVNGAMENAMRLATFATARRNGMSAQQAAFIARNVTVDFERKGQAGFAMNALYVFSNANLQGSRRMMAAMKSGKLMTTVAAFAGLAFMLAELNRVGGGDDDDGIPFWDKIPEWEKERNLIIMIPGKLGEYLKIPLAYGYNVFWSIGGNLNAAMHGQSAKESALNIAASIFGAFNPISNAQASNAASLALKNVSSWITDPLVDIAVNESFSGRPVSPPRNKYDTRPDAEIYFPRTNPAYVGAARWLNEATGGNRIRPGVMDISPNSFEYVADFLIGGAGRFVAQTAKIGKMAATGELGEVPIRDFPIINRFYGEPVDYRVGKSYMRNSQETELRLNEFRMLGEDNPEAARRYAEEHKAVLKLELTPGQIRQISKGLEPSRLSQYDRKPVGKDIEKQLRALGDQLDEAKAQGDKETEKKIQEQRNNLMMSYNREFNLATGRNVTKPIPVITPLAESLVGKAKEK